MTEGGGRNGRVYLVGAGPGDPELLTLKAARVIGAADVILLDALVDRRVLAHARPASRVIDVGKRGGCRSTPQPFIERLMVRLARAGCIVARVKGGDPFVFGRGGEEALALARAGVDFEVVCGVSSGIAAPASAGIPVTHRGLCAGVTFLSGHSTGDENPDWDALVRSRTTLVIFMGVAGMHGIVERLLAAGMPADTPAAAIERATWADQRVFRIALARLPEHAARAGLRSPAILVVGACAALADMLSHAREAACVESLTRVA
jgi:uroporphyrin-III C-methyltransferase